MRSFTFVHAADLHLDAALSAGDFQTAGQSDAFAALLKKSVYQALERLAEVCISSNAQFLVLAGDVFHQGEGSLSGNLKLRDIFLRLAEHNIEVFWARGNHDPAAASAQSIAWPKNLHLFSKEGDVFTVMHNGQPLALVQGISHSGSVESENLAKTMQGLYKNSPAASMAKDLFKVGVLHCAVRGKSGKHNNYAPCSLEDLQGNDYWALGHVHTRAVLATTPPVVYPGSVQGLHINEGGTHGCTIVQVDQAGRTTLKFEPLAPVRWEKLNIDISENDKSESSVMLDSLEDYIVTAMCETAKTAVNEQPVYPLSAVVFRLELQGRTSLDSFLRKGGNIEDLTERLNTGLARGYYTAMPLEARIKDIVLATAPNIDMESLLQNDNLVGETLRQARNVSNNLLAGAEQGAEQSSFEDLLATLPPEAQKELLDLYGNKRVARYLTLPDSAELAAIANQASLLCLDMFEVNNEN